VLELIKAVARSPFTKRVVATGLLLLAEALIQNPGKRKR
jgi:hypothetical protein